jgi:dolichol-phosphate mannosyltransferase
MLRFAVDGITSFSTVPLRIAIWLGVIAGMIALAGGVWAIYVKLFGQGVVPGWTTIMILVSGGSSAQLLMTGILGEYVGRIYEEVKRRPLYVVRDEINLGGSGNGSSNGSSSAAPAGGGADRVEAGTQPSSSAAGTRLRPPSDDA